MSIFIKGLKMPTEGRFMAIYKLQGKFYVSQNGELCPIIELPDHGDLVDIDAMLGDFAELRDYDFASREYVVIPAERNNE